MPRFDIHLREPHLSFKYLAISLCINKGECTVRKFVCSEMGYRLIFQLYIRNRSKKTFRNFLNRFNTFLSYDFDNVLWSPLPTKGCKYLPFLGTHGHWAVRVLKRTTPTLTRGIRLKWSFLRTRDTHTNCRAFTCSSGAVTAGFYDLGLSQLGFELPIFRLRFQRS